MVCRHGAKFTATVGGPPTSTGQSTGAKDDFGRPADVDISGKALAAKDDFAEICGLGTELGGSRISQWILNDARLNDDTPMHDEDRICLALHPIGLYCGVRANMAEVMSFRVIKGDLPVAVNEDYCPDR